MKGATIHYNALQCNAELQMYQLHNGSIGLGMGIAKIYLCVKLGIICKDFQFLGQGGGGRYNNLGFILTRERGWVRLILTFLTCLKQDHHRMMVKVKGI